MADPLEYLQLESLTRLAERLEALVRGRLWAQVLAGMAAGIGVGLLLGPDLALVPPPIAEPLVAWVALPGKLFLGLIQMIVVPLVFASVVRGLTAGSSLEELRRVGGRALVFFVGTTAIATIIGIGVTIALNPGQFVDASAVAGARPPSPSPAQLPSVGEIPDALTNLLPTNPLESLVGGQMLQIILFAVLMGVALISLPPERSAPLYDVLGSLQDVCMTVVKWAMRLAPIAVFGLTARLTASLGLTTLAGMAAYVGTVLLGLVALFVLYLGLGSAVARLSPLVFVARCRELLLLAFSTSSSAAVMPLSMKTVEDAFDIDPSVSRLVVPLGATVNMTGTALYQGAATVFLAQVYGVDLAPSALVLVVVTAVAASIGSPATPGVGMVILATVLAGVGIPASGIALLMGVDRVLDMSRTSVNVLGDVVACVLLGRRPAPVIAASPAAVDPP